MGVCRTNIWFRALKLGALAHIVDTDLRARDVRLTMGGEPTFVGIDEPESLDAPGPMKQTRGRALIRCLREKTALGAVLHALSENGQKLYVFTVTATSASPAPGSSYNILGPLNMIVQPR
jgi:uncharacterized protein (DUF2126 family)